MKILQLRLLAFGPFTDVSLDLSAGHEGLHLIYGPNEAGKSTALRAIEQMLYGIPHHSRDDFLHPASQLRIGATVRAADGRVIEFVRRKGRKGTLLAADNKTPIDERTLQSILGDVDRDGFVTRFGIDHEELVRGGQEIVAGRGEVGQLLFAAGAGVAELRSICRQLDEQADALFAPRAQKPRLNSKLREVQETKKQLRQMLLAGSEWETHQQALQEAQKRLALVQSQLSERMGQRSRLERFRRALPLAARRRDCGKQLAELGPVPRLPEDFPESRRQLTTQLTLARQRHQTACEEIQQIERALASIDLPQPLLSRAEEIEALRDALASYRKAQRDLPGLEARRQQVEAEALSVLRDLRPDGTLDDVDSMRLPMDQRMQIEELSQQSARLASQIEHAEEEIRQTELQRRQTQAELEQLPPSRDPSPLADLLRRRLAEGDLEMQRAEAAVQLATAEQQAEAELGRLGLWSGVLDEVDQLPVPQPETVERYDAQMSECHQRIRTVEEKLEDAKMQRLHAGQKLEELRLAGEVPSEDDLLDKRRLRDLGWQVIKAEWLEGEADVDRYEEFVTSFEGQTDLAAAYEQAVADADQVADRLRREADRVARRAQLQAACEDLDRQLAKHSEQLAELRREKQRLQTQWTECWRPAGIAPLTPKEMLAWLRRHQSLAGRVAEIRRQRQLVELLDRRVAAARDELGQALVAVGEPPPGPRETLAALTDRAQRVVAEIERVEQTRIALKGDLEKLERRLAEARARAEEARQQQSRWQAAWQETVRPLGLGAEATPAVVHAYLARLGEMFERLTEARGFAERIEMIRRDAEAFAARVRHLASQIDPALADRPFEEAAEQLIGRLAIARQNQQRQEELEKNRRRFCAERDRAAEQIEALSAQLTTMCQEAGCQTPDQLPQVEAAAARAAQLEETRRQLDDQLLALSGGASLEQFLQELDDVDPDQLPAELENLSHQIEQLEAEQGELREQIGSHRRALQTMDAGPQAAEAAEQIQDLLAQIEDDAAQYARFRLASVVLQTAIQRYQQAHEAPVLRRAGELFSQLTLGSFRQLRADFDAQGEKVLMGDRGDGSPPVDLAGMSDGTCDQLYLALRLASLEHDLAGREPLPLIVDDVLISFDDHRAVAALRTLAELSRRTQVIFFTHHWHLAQLAQQHLDPDVLFVHQLPGRAPAAPS